MTLHISDSIVSALIGATATVLAAAIPALITKRKRRRVPKRPRADRELRP